LKVRCENRKSSDGVIDSSAGFGGRDYRLLRKRLLSRINLLPWPVTLESVFRGARSQAPYEQAAPEERGGAGGTIGILGPETLRARLRRVPHWPVVAAGIASEESPRASPLDSPRPFSVRPAIARPGPPDLGSNDGIRGFSFRRVPRSRSRSRSIQGRIPVVAPAYVPGVLFEGSRSGIRFRFSTYPRFAFFCTSSSRAESGRWLSVRGSARGVIVKVTGANGRRGGSHWQASQACVPVLETS
jgi:hypothetical protein